MSFSYAGGRRHPTWHCSVFGTQSEKWILACSTGWMFQYAHHHGNTLWSVSLEEVAVRHCPSSWSFPAATSFGVLEFHAPPPPPVTQILDPPLVGPRTTPPSSRKTLGGYRGGPVFPWDQLISNHCRFLQWIWGDWPITRAWTQHRWFAAWKDTLLAMEYLSPPAKSQNPSPPLRPTTDKLGFSGCLEQSVVTPNPVVGQSTGVHNQSNDDLFRQMEKTCVSMATRSHERAPKKIPFTLSARPSTSFVRFVAKKDWTESGAPYLALCYLVIVPKKAKKQVEW